MSLSSLLNASSTKRKKIGVSEERIRACLPNMRKLIGFWREYPDLFVDFLVGPNGTFKFYAYQRVFLRAVCRHRYAYCTYPRAYSKSFLTVMASMIRCILYPGAKLFVCSGGKLLKILYFCRLLTLYKRLKEITAELSWKAEMLIRTEGSYESGATHRR